MIKNELEMQKMVTYPALSLALQSSNMKNVFLFEIESHLRICELPTTFLIQKSGSAVILNNLTR